MHAISDVYSIDTNVILRYIYRMSGTIQLKTMPSIIIRDIDIDLRKRLRRICLDMDASMNETLKILIAEYVEKKEKEVKKK